MASKAEFIAGLAALAVGSGFCAAALAGPYSDEYGGLHHATSVAFRGWASGCVEYTRPDSASGGFACNDKGARFTNLAEAVLVVLGKPAAFDLDAATRHVLSLGNGGSIVLTFESPIEDAAGPDFAVFENAFTDTTDFTGTSREEATNTFCFAELAFVEVATRTSAWARFPVTCLNSSVLHSLNNVDQEWFASQDVSLLDGLAGKHRIEYGTPFDLGLLTNDPAVLAGAVDLRCIRYVRLTDVIGDGSTTDAAGRAIYDPYYDYFSGYPNPAHAAATDGFDLRAVGVIHFITPKMTPGADGMIVSWFAASGITYQVQASLPDMQSWSDLGAPLAGDDEVHSVTDSVPAAVRLYRLLEMR